MKKLVSLLVALMMVFSLSLACAEEVDWLNVDWDAKTVKYQFTGSWELPENGISFHFLINLYEDGTALVEQLSGGATPSYQQFGTWSEELTEDGNEIAFATVLCTNEGELIPHEYEYDLYEEEDGSYSFGYTFGIIPGQYYRDVDMIGSAEIQYATLADYIAAFGA